MKNLLCFLFLLFFYSFIIAQNKDNTVRIGIISDVHGEKERLQTFIDRALEEKPDFIIQLGDLSNGKEEETANMLAVWNSYPGIKYHVLGNHEFDYSTKEIMMQRKGMDRAYYSFDYKDFHFVVLDCNFIRKDGEYIDYANANYYIDKESRDLISPEQIKWLEKDIKSTDKTVVIFSHQSFDDITMRGANPVPNKMELRDCIDAINKDSKNKVIACFAGHDHIDLYNQINGVHFFSVNSAYGFKKSLELKEGIYAFVTFDSTERTITIEGTQTEFKKTPSPEDYGHYLKELIHPYISNRKVNF